MDKIMGRFTEDAPLEDTFLENLAITEQEADRDFVESGAKMDSELPVLLDAHLPKKFGGHTLCARCGISENYFGLALCIDTVDNADVDDDTDNADDNYEHYWRRDDEDDDENEREYEE